MKPSTKLVPILALLAPTAIAAQELSVPSYRVELGPAVPELTVSWTQTFTPAGGEPHFLATVHDRASRQNVAVPFRMELAKADGAAPRTASLAFQLARDGLLTQSGSRYLAVQVCTRPCSDSGVVRRDLLVDLATVQAVVSLNAQLREAQAPRPANSTAQLQAFVTPLANSAIVELSTRSGTADVMVEAVQNGIVRASSPQAVSLFPVEGFAQHVQLDGLIPNTTLEIRLKDASGKLLQAVRSDFAGKPLRTLSALSSPTIVVDPSSTITYSPTHLRIPANVQSATAVTYEVHEWNATTGTAGARVQSSVVRLDAGWRDDGQPHAIPIEIPHTLAAERDYRVTLTAISEYGPAGAPDHVAKSGAATRTLRTPRRLLVDAVQLSFTATSLVFQATTNGTSAQLAVTPGVTGNVELTHRSAPAADPTVSIPLAQLRPFLASAQAANTLRFRIAVTAADGTGREDRSVVAFAVQPQLTDNDSKRRMREALDELRKTDPAQRDNGKEVKVKDLVQAGLPILLQVLAAF